MKKKECSRCYYYRYVTKEVSKYMKVKVEEEVEAILFIIHLFTSDSELKPEVKRGSCPKLIPTSTYNDQKVNRSKDNNNHL